MRLEPNIDMETFDLAWGKRYRFFSRGEEQETLFPGRSLAVFSLKELGQALGSEELFYEPWEVFLQAGGWQSWSPGWELAPEETHPSKTRLYPDLIRMSRRPGALTSRGETAGHFIMYVRRHRAFLCLASGEGAGLPPITYIIGREKMTVRLECYVPGRRIAPGECLGEINVFITEGYFALKDTLRSIYNADFSSLDFLRPAGRGKARTIGGYETWYNHYTDIREDALLSDLDSLSQSDNIIKLRYLDRGTPAVFQVDDGWEREVGEWEVNSDRFPSGLRSLAEKAESAGFIPGLWLAPLLVTARSRIFTEKPDWVLRDEDGCPVSAGYNPSWGGRFYSLNLSALGVLPYLDALMDKVINDWGFRYIKLDFMYAGFSWGDGQLRGSDPAALYNEACRVLTARRKRGDGKPVAYLGCGVPLGPSWRYFPLSRIGADTRETWDWTGAWLLGHIGRPSAHLNLRDTIGRAFLDGTVFLNDPDVVFFRSKNCSLNETEKELIALVSFLLGSQIMVSDAPGELTPRDIAFTRRVAALYDELEDDEYGAARIPAPWGVRGAPDAYRLISRSGRVAGVINLGRFPLCLHLREGLPYAAEAALSLRSEGGRFLTDHRIPLPFQWASDRFTVFAPRSITVVKKG